MFILFAVLVGFVFCLMFSLTVICLFLFCFVCFVLFVLVLWVFSFLVLLFVCLLLLCGCLCLFVGRASHSELGTLLSISQRSSVLLQVCNFLLMM